MRRHLALVVLMVLVTGSWAGAWSFKEHIQLSRIAAERLIADPATPPAMREWLRAAAPGLLDEAGEREYLLRQRVGAFSRGVDGIAFWAVMPDMLAGSTRSVEPFGVPERQLHFIDMEVFYPDAAKRSYCDDLSHKPKLADFPRDMKDPRYAKSGMLPFRVEDCVKQMAAAVRAGRLTDTPGQYPRDEHAAKWAGYLAHYAADSTQPQHATMDYKSASYFPGSNYPPNIHGDMEYRLVDDDARDYPALREEFWTLFLGSLQETQPSLSRDPWQGTIETCLISYDALPVIGRAAVAAYGEVPEQPGAFNAEIFFHYRGRFLGRDMSVLGIKAHQWALAVKRIEALWLTAWTEGVATAPAATAR